MDISSPFRKNGLAGVDCSKRNNPSPYHQPRDEDVNCGR